MMSYEKRYFNLAKAMAICSQHPKFYIGCCIISAHKVISVANNQVKSHPIQKQLNILRFVDKHDSSKDLLHAELAAILKVKNKDDLRNASIYVYREDRNRHIACARPCPACLKKIREVGIRTIYYTTRDGLCKEVLR